MSLKGNLLFKGVTCLNSVRRIEKITKVVKPAGSEHVVIEVATYMNDPLPRGDSGEDYAMFRANYSCTPAEYEATFKNSTNLQADAYNHLKTFPEFSSLVDC